MRHGGPVGRFGAKQGRKVLGFVCIRPADSGAGAPALNPPSQRRTRHRSHSRCCHWKTRPPRRVKPTGTGPCTLTGHLKSHQSQHRKHHPFSSPIVPAVLQSPEGKKDSWKRVGEVQLENKEKAVQVLIALSAAATPRDVLMKPARINMWLNQYPIAITPLQINMEPKA